MKKVKKALYSILVLGLLLSLVFTGCDKSGDNDAGTTEQTESSKSETTHETTGDEADVIDLSKEETLKGYLLSDPPSATQEILDKLNIMLKDDINTLLDVNYISFGDFDTKYPLILSSGEEVDFIIAASWGDYPNYARDGAFQELKMETIERLMPRHIEAMVEGGWNEVMIDGKIYMIPQSFTEVSIPAIVIRADLRKEYGIPEITSVVDIEPYLEAVKENEPDMIPYNMDKLYLESLLMQYTYQDVGYGLKNAVGNEAGVARLYFSLDNFDETQKLVGILDEPYLSSFREGAALMQRLHDKGLTPKNPFQNETRSYQLIQEGRSALGYTNNTEPAALYSSMEEKGMEIELIPALSPGGLAYRRPQNGNGFAIPKSSGKLERTLYAFDLIIHEQEYNYLVSFGIEGEHYYIDDEGKLALPEGITEANHPYPMYGAGWWFTDRAQWPSLASYSDYYIEKNKQILSVAVKAPFTGFSVDLDAYKTEIANITNIYQEYGMPIFVGAVDDSDAAIDDFIERLKDAGLEKVQEEIRKQAEEYMTAMP